MSANSDSDRPMDNTVTVEEVTITSNTGDDADSSTTSNSCTCPTAADGEAEAFAAGGERKKFEMLANLWPKGAEPYVSVDELLDFFSHILGPFYNDEVAKCLADIMNPDAEGKITRENFARAFCLDNWPKDHVAAMRQVFITRPEIINEIVDWKAVIDRMGLNMTDSDLGELIEHAKSSATDMLKKDASEANEVDSEKVEQKTEELLKMIMGKLGKTSIDSSSRNLPSGETVEPSNQEKN